MARITRTERIRRYRGLVKLVEENPAIQWAWIENERLSRKEVLALLQGFLDAARATDAARITLTLAVKKERRALDKSHALLESLKLGAHMHLGPRSAKLTRYEIDPERTPKKKSLETLKQQIEKTRATRIARGTMKKKA